MVACLRALKRTHLDETRHGCLFGTRIGALEGILDGDFDLERAQWVQVGKELCGGNAVGLARITQAVDEDGQQPGGLRGEHPGLILEL